MADSCNKCQWAVKRSGVGITGIMAGFKALPTWDHFHKENGKFVFFDSRKRAAQK